MTGRTIRFLAAFGILVIGVARVGAATFITADLDVRYRYRGYTDHRVGVEGLGLGVRQVFADTAGDRLTLFAFAQAWHDFNEVMLEQGYVQYKGPMGAWAVSLGRFTVPFGLLPNYQTERLLLKTLEDVTLGMLTDSGAMLSGVVHDFDYAVSFTQGIGVSGWRAVHGSGVISGRLGWQGADDTGVRLGVSAAYGATVPDTMHGGGHDTERRVRERRLVAADAIKYSGTRVFRAEITGGTVDAEPFFGAFWGVDFGVASAVDLSVGHRYVHHGPERAFAVTGGVSFNDIFGFQVRIAQEYFFIGEGAHEFTVQVYRAIAFSR
jgi:hypothetical protein